MILGEIHYLKECYNQFGQCQKENVLFSGIPSLCCKRSWQMTGFQDWWSKMRTFTRSKCMYVARSLECVYVKELDKAWRMTEGLDGRPDVTPLSSYRAISLNLEQICLISLSSHWQRRALRGQFFRSLLSQIFACSNQWCCIKVPAL